MQSLTGKILRRNRLLAVLLVGVLLAASVAVDTTARAADDPPTLDFDFLEAPLPDLLDVAWGNDLFVAVGGDGAILTSPDGYDWRRETDVPHWLAGRHIMAITYGNSGFVAVTSDGDMIHSQDGIHWQGQRELVKVGLYGITHRVGRYVAVGADGTVVHSNDITNKWDIVDTGVEETLFGVYVTEFPHVIVVSGSGGTLLTSINFQTWYSRTTGFSGTLRSAVCHPVETAANGREMVVVGDSGKIFTSDDNGETWTEQVSGTSLSLRGIDRFGDRMYVVGANGRILVSQDAKNWSDQSYGNHYMHSFSGIAYNDRRVPNDAIVTVAMCGFVYRRPWLGSWEVVRGGSLIQLRDVHYGNNRFIGVGSITSPPQMFVDGYSLYSDDGETWTGTAATPFYMNAIASLTPRGDVFAGGSSGKIYTSADGVTWQERSSAYSNEVFDMISIPFGLTNRRLIAVGRSSLIQYTNDGTHWTTPSSSGAIDLYGLDFFAKEEMVFVVGSQGSVYSSDYGHEWILEGELDITIDLLAVASYDRLVAVGTDGAIWTSETGKSGTWVERTSGTQEDLRDVAWIGDRFIAVGNNGTILFSWDGITWHRTKERLTAYDLLGVHAYDDQVVVVGDRMTVLGASTREVLPPVERISGTNRFWTAIEISQAGWADDSSPYVLLARSHDFADALAGVPLAHALNAPILLVDRTMVRTSVMTEIQRLGATDVILLGGTAAISDDVKTFLEGEGMTVERLAGSGRYATAAAIAERLEEVLGHVDRAVIAVGTDFPDALSAASYAAMNGYPILLTHPTILPGSTQQAIYDLTIQHLVVAGGEAAVSSDVFDALDVIGTKTRVSDTNRYTTAVAMAEHFDPGSDHYYLATGTDFPDAITGAVLAARQGTGVLLVWGPGSNPGGRIETFFTDYEVERVTLFGGIGAIGTAMEDWMENFFGSGD